MDPISVFSKTAVLFALMATGFAASKSGIFPKEAIRPVSRLLVSVSMPALIIVSMQKPYGIGDAGMVLFMIAAAAAVYFFCMLIGFPLTAFLRSKGKAKGVLHFALVFSNVAFMGFPVVETILGKDAVFYLSVYNIPFQILAFSVGILIVSRGGTDRVKVPVMEAVLNPNVIAALAGLALFLTGTNLPGFANDFLSLLGSLTTPLSMIVIGASIANTDIRAAIRDYRIWAVSSFRLAILPIALFAILKAAGITGTALAIPVIVAGMPVAANTALLAETYDGDTQTAGILIALSTLLSVVTIPFIAFLITR